MSAPNPTSLERLEAAARACRDDLKLVGRWGWFGDIKHGGAYLATQTGGRRFVMQFARLGMRDGQPVFPVQDGKWVHVERGQRLAVYEVAPDATSPDDPRVYRHDVTGFRSPVADFLAACDAETVLALIERVRELEASA